MARAVGKLHRELLNIQAVFGGAERQSQPGSCRASATHMDRDPTGLMFGRNSSYSCGEVQDQGIPDVRDFTDANAAVHDRRSDQIWQCELRLHDLRRSTFVRGAKRLLV